MHKMNLQRQGGTIHRMFRTGMKMKLQQLVFHVIKRNPNEDIFWHSDLESMPVIHQNQRLILGSKLEEYTTN